MTSLQNPVSRPSMMGLGNDPNDRVAMATVMRSRAAASVSPTDAYSGSVKLPIGLTWLGSAMSASSTAFVAATNPSRTASWHHHGTSSGIAGGEDMGRGGPQMPVDVDVPAPVNFDPGSIEVQLVVAATQPDRDYSHGRVDRAFAIACRVDHRTPVGYCSNRSIVPASSSTWIPDALREALTAWESSSSSLIKIPGQPRRAGHVSEHIEDRGHLHSCGAASKHEQRRRH